MRSARHKVRNNYESIRDTYARWGSISAVQLVLGVSIPTIRRALRHRDSGKTATSSPGGTGIAGRGGVILPRGHRADVEARPLFPTQVRPLGRQPVLKSGEHSAKIGGVILKGPWRGLPVYTLTLQERATCPRSCAHWLNCYGNNAPYALRFQHGPDLERRIAGEVNDLCALNPGGIALRLHNLGDFYSVDYVHLWRSLIQRHPQLRAFGFSARCDAGDPIARELAQVIGAYWPRFAIRLSNASGIRSTVSIASAEGRPSDAIICPQQQGKTESCSTCALCWQTDRRIAFLEH